MTLSQDIRRWDPTPNPKAIREAIDLFARSRELDLRLSRVLAVIETMRAHEVEGSATIGEFARRNGFDGLRATELARLGRAVEMKPEMAPKLESGQLTIAAAAAVAPILLSPKAQKPGEDWAKKAEERPLPELRREVKFRVEEVRQGAPVTLPITVAVSQETCDEFGRVRLLVSQVEKKQFSESQTFAWMTRHSLECLDPLRKKHRKRRMEPTAKNPGKRGKPAEVVAAIARRSGLLCEFTGCTRVATEKAHVHPHALGSGREERDLWDACKTHHTMYDKAKTIRISGWDRDGKPIFVFADGRPVRARPATTRGPRPEDRKRGRASSTEDRATRAPQE